jgi:hypothetical protein
MHTHGVYGGVQFGLDKFQLATSVGRTSGIQFPGAALSATSIGRGPGAGISATMPQHRLAFGLSRKAGIAPVSNIMSIASGAQFAPPSAALSAASLPPARLGAALSAASIGAPRISAMAAGLSTMPSAPRLQGVDLRLDQFDLSEAKRVSLEAQEGSWHGQARSLDECCAFGSAFFACIDGTEKMFKEEDMSLLQKIFHPSLTDRRSEGDVFVPPDASFSYVHKLRALVKEEDAVREHRKQMFFSPGFVIGNPGPLFPHSWTSSFEISRGKGNVLEGQPVGALISRPEYKGQTSTLLHHLKSSAPVFDKSTEESLRFRIYRLGSLEVRTTQEAAADEIIGAVFSIRNQAPKTNSSKPKSLDEKDKIVKVSEYVERAFTHGRDASALQRRYYLVLETDKGNKIVSERLNDRQLTWVVDPDDVDDRNSLAKLTRSETATTGVIVRDMQACRAKLAEDALSSKRYVQSLFMRAAGSKLTQRPSSFRDPVFWH